MRAPNGAPTRCLDRLNAADLDLELIWWISVARCLPGSDHAGRIALPTAASTAGRRSAVDSRRTVTLLGGTQESAFGYKQTLAGLKTTSALHPGADLPGGVSNGLLLTRSGPYTIS